jgi:hypothetical protein
MRKVLYTTALLLLSSNLLFAQFGGFTPIKKNGIKFNLFSPIYKNLSITSQHLITPTKSINITAAYMDFNDFNGNDKYNTWNTTGFSIIPEYRTNYTGYGLNGFYAAPFLRYMFYKTNYDNKELNGSVTSMGKGQFQSIGVGFILGKQYIIKNNILIDFFAGPAYQILFQNKKDYRTAYEINDGNLLSDAIPNRYLSGYSIRAGITIGLAY